ncbi:Tn3 family transposase [Streptomyces cyaneofuscatus]|uniref:Tn3 family transposase n=1 Tax=Streptomyces cyaneofuscatus TaxID=66883 RepID=UPI00378C592B
MRGRWTATLGRPGRTPSASSSMLGWVAAVRGVDRELPHGAPAHRRRRPRPGRAGEGGLDIAEIVRQLQEEGHTVDPEDLAHISPYLTEHIRRFGEYSTHDLDIEPEAYDPHLDVDFAPLRGDAERAPGGYGQAA